MSDKLSYFAHRVQGKIRQLRTIAALRKEYRAIFRKNPNTVFLVMTPDHGNLGDHALAYSEIRLLEQAGIDYIEITARELSQMRWTGLLPALDGFPILVNGGGNLGTLWFGVEDVFRKLIEKAPRSKILLLPNTIFYEDSDWGRIEFEQSKRIYCAHKHLRLYAREQHSFDLMRSAYHDVHLMPDMVMSLSKCSDSKERSGCLICLRSDCEKTRTDEQETILRRQAAELFGDAVADTDMDAGYRISAEQREAELQAKFDQFSSAELVITDRLHGMIFCAVTGTPCIVINSKSPKVRGCYEWIKHLEYIRFADSVSDIAALYSEIPRKKHIYQNAHMQHYYDELIEVIKALCP